MGERSTITLLGNAASLPLAASPLTRLPAPPPARMAPPRRDEVQWSQEAQRHYQGPYLSANAAVMGRATANDSTLFAPHLLAAQLQLLAEAASRIRAGTAGRIDARSGLSASGSLEGEGAAIAHASAHGSIMATPMLLAAQAQLLSEASARLRTGAAGRVDLGHDLFLQGSVTAEADATARANAHGSATLSSSMIDAHGILLAEAVARTMTDATGHLEATHALVVDAGVTKVAMLGTRTVSSGDFQFGIDRDGLPSFRLAALSESTSGASAKTLAHGQVSLLGLVTLGASGSMEALAGLASGISGDISLQGRVLTISTGARAAMGYGAGASGSITIGLGKLPSGILKTVVGPIVALPTLLVSSVVHGLNRLSHDSGPDPMKDALGITDYPQIAVANVEGGLKMIGQGCQETLDQIEEVGTAVGHGVLALANGVADAGSSFFHDLKDLVSGHAKRTTPPTLTPLMP